jgi:hypothetical protein
VTNAGSKPVRRDKSGQFDALLVHWTNGDMNRGEQIDVSDAAAKLPIFEGFESCMLARSVVGTADGDLRGNRLTCYSAGTCGKSTAA